MNNPSCISSHKSPVARKKQGIKLDKPRSAPEITPEDGIGSPTERAEIMNYLQEIQECNQRYENIIERYLQGIKELKTILESVKQRN